MNKPQQSCVSLKTKDRSVLLQWKDSPGLRSVEVQVRRGAGPWTGAGKFSGDRTECEIGGLVDGPSWQFRYRFLQDIGEESWTETESIKPQPNKKIPLGRVIVDHSTTGDQRSGNGCFLPETGGKLSYLYTAYTDGTHDWSPACIKIIRSQDSGESWSTPEVLFKLEGYSLLQPGAIVLKDGTIGVTYQIGSGFDAPARRVFRKSSDEGQTWSDEIAITDGTYRYMTGAEDRLVQLSNGRLICQVHSIIAPRLLGTDIFLSDNEGQSWRRNRSPTLMIPACDPSMELDGERGANEATIVEPQAGKLILFARTATGFLWRSESSDSGDTWSELKPCNIRHPQACPRATMIPGTERIALFHNSFVDMTRPMKGDRTILAVALSDDLGRTWQNYRTIECVEGYWHDYPDLTWIGETLHLAYRSGVPRYSSGEFWMYQPRPWDFVDVRYQRFSKQDFLSKAPYLKKEP